MKITNLGIVIATSVFAMIVVGVLGWGAPWLARANIFELTAREPKKTNAAEPDAALNGDPATPIDNSEATEGPPPVS